jgi:hypothetical protein
MQMNKVWGSVVIACLTFMACHNKQQYYESKDHDLTVQIVKMKNDAADTASVSYTARIIPDKTMMTVVNNEDIKTAMMYKMDSCFYMQINKKKVYPGIVQSIANGLPNQFEYLVSFDIAGISNDNPVIVYQDKYLNKRKYTLKINKE